ncbi:MAG: hypothetical protein GF404_09070 [candidate division Zixibacteria bacterium]|nr:hypothetical protein [candidate division Zixibacteria bacterium]
MGLDTSTSSGKFLKGIETGFKRLAFQIFRLSGKIKKAEGEFEPDKIKKVLFIAHFKLGDMIVSLPVYHNLRKQYPDLQIDVLCSRGNREIIKNDPNIDNIHVYNKKPLKDKKIMARLKRESYDCVVDLLFGDSVTALIQTALIAGSAFKLAVGKRKYSRHYDLATAAEDRPQPVIDRTARVLKLFTVEPQKADLRPKIYLSDDERRASAEFVSEMRSKYDTVVCINLSAGRPARTWPLSKYVLLLKILHADYPDTGFVLNYAPDEYEKAVRVTELDLKRIHPLPRGLKFMEVAGFLSRVDYFISPDTSLHHIAAAFDIPSIIFFSGNDDNFTIWQPYNRCIHPLRSSDYYEVAPIMPEQVALEYERLISTHPAEKTQ